MWNVEVKGILDADLSRYQIHGFELERITLSQSKIKTTSVGSPKIDIDDVECIRRILQENNSIKLFLDIAIRDGECSTITSIRIWPNTNIDQVLQQAKDRVGGNSDLLSWREGDFFQIGDATDYYSKVFAHIDKVPIVSSIEQLTELIKIHSFDPANLSEEQLHGGMEAYLHFISTESYGKCSVVERYLFEELLHTLMRTEKLAGIPSSAARIFKEINNTTIFGYDISELSLARTYFQSLTKCSFEDVTSVQQLLTFENDNLPIDLIVQEYIKSVDTTDDPTRVKIIEELRELAVVNNWQAVLSLFARTENK